VQLGPVRTYYEEDGADPPLVLLHPGLADSRAFERSVPGLAERFRVFTADVEGPITYDGRAVAVPEQMRRPADHIEFLTEGEP
jgi:pimeloyl-ACP methyl ester carboxylesterase